MENEQNEVIALELAKRVGDFYFSMARNYVATCHGKFWFKVPASQVSKLRQEFDKGGNDNVQRKKNIKSYLENQTKKVDESDKKPYWQKLVHHQNLLKFIFPERTKLIQEITPVLRDMYRDSHLGLIVKYFTTETNDMQGLLDWQTQKLMPMISEKRFLTLLSLHRVCNSKNLPKEIKAIMEVKHSC